jgi:hypothetical protein
MSSLFEFTIERGQVGLALDNARGHQRGHQTDVERCFGAAGRSSWSAPRRGTRTPTAFTSSPRSRRRASSSLSSCATSSRPPVCRTLTGVLLKASIGTFRLRLPSGRYLHFGDNRTELSCRPVHVRVRAGHVARGRAIWLRQHLLSRATRRSCQAPQTPDKSRLARKRDRMGQLAETRSASVVMGRGRVTSGRIESSLGGEHAAKEQLAGDRSSRWSRCAWWPMRWRALPHRHGALARCKCCTRLGLSQHVLPDRRRAALACWRMLAGRCWRARRWGRAPARSWSGTAASC